ncbi:MAG: C39 family peptidase [Oscillospiraceae bacterium]|nr:C39 family peptidase [Oscillospiraceae bacterium]
MNKEWKMVRAFHEKFGHPISNIPIIMEKERVKKRYNWMLEEINEFMEAEDLVEQADAMIDVIYFALGTLVEMGILPDELFNIVHKANMLKLWEDGNPHYNAEGKTIKPINWKDPYNKLYTEILKQQRCHMYVKEVVVAKPNYCVPASILMVLHHYGIYEYSQEMIANNLFITPCDDKIDHRLWGTYIDNNTLNTFFNKAGINLSETFLGINMFMDEWLMSEKINELLSNDISIICGYNYTYLFGNKEDTFGHVSVIIGVSEDNNSIDILDPGPKNAGLKTVSSSDLFYAIKAKNDGLWCIGKK